MTQIAHPGYVSTEADVLNASLFAPRYCEAQFAWKRAYRALKPYNVVNESLGITFPSVPHCPAAFFGISVGLLYDIGRRLVFLYSVMNGNVFVAVMTFRKRN